MKSHYLLREYHPDRTMGRLFANGEEFSTIERSWEDNESNISCIPAGMYTVHYLHRSASGKYREVWHLQCVNKRFGILMHKGNLARHSKGCIILGSKRGWLGGQPAVLGSGTALRKFNRLQNREPFELHIIGTPP